MGGFITKHTPKYINYKVPVLNILFLGTTLPDNQDHVVIPCFFMLLKLTFSYHCHCIYLYWPLFYKEEDKNHANIQSI